MSEHVGQVQALSVEQLPELHAVTKVVAGYCQKELQGYLGTLSPLFQPRRLLGQHIEGSGRHTVLKANESFAQLRELYSRVARVPFDLRSELSSPLESISSQLKLYPWEEDCKAVGEQGRPRNLTVTCPLTWVLSYPSTYSYSMIRQVLAGKQERDSEAVQAFVLRSCVMKVLLDRYPELVTLLKGLRFRVEVRRSPQTGELPLVTISAPLATLRPPDPILIIAASVAGGSSFEEILDLESLNNVSDPWREKINDLVTREQI